MVKDTVNKDMVFKFKNTFSKKLYRLNFTPKLKINYGIHINKETGMKDTVNNYIPLSRSDETNQMKIHEYFNSPLKYKIGNFTSSLGTRIKMILKLDLIKESYGILILSIKTNADMKF